MCLTGQVSPLSLSAPCASLLKLHTLLKRTLIPGREGDGKLGQLNVCLFLSVRSRLLNWNPFTSWGPWPLKFLAKFVYAFCISYGTGSISFIRISKGYVDSEVKHCGTRWCYFPWILVYFSRRNDRKFEIHREVGGWVILSKQLQDLFPI